MIHVVGNAAIDTIIRLERLPRAGETVVALGAAEDLGGKGANQAVAIARAGVAVRLVAAVGTDGAGETIRSSLAAEGVTIEGLHVWPGATDHCIVYVDRDGENTIVSLIDAARSFAPAAASVERGDWLLMQGNLGAATTFACLAAAKLRGATTVLNPSPTYSPADYDWRVVDIAILNRQEALDLGGGDDPRAAARRLLDAGAGVVVLTLGADGAAFFARDDAFEARPPKIEAVDAVGAGDVFCGTLIAVRASGRSWREAMGAACASAALSVTRRGVRSAFPTRAEIAGILAAAARPTKTEAA